MLWTLVILCPRSIMPRISSAQAPEKRGSRENQLRYEV